VYFKLEKLDKAEEIYRKLAAESPDVPTLYYNLGLIYFKLGKLEDAESAFAKALQLSGDNPKVHFYLGSIYERLRRYQDAIYQYRQPERVSWSGAWRQAHASPDPAATAHARRGHRRVQGPARPAFEPARRAADRSVPASPETVQPPARP